jgi:hypothetical protein
MRRSAPASAPPLPRLRAWQWALVLLLSPILVPFVVVQFLLGLVLDVPMPADVSPAPDPAPRRRPRRPKAVPITVDAVGPIAEAEDAEPADVSSPAPHVAYRAERCDLRGGFIAAAPYRFRGG